LEAELGFQNSEFLGHVVPLKKGSEFFRNTKIPDFLLHFSTHIGTKLLF